MTTRRRVFGARVVAILAGVMLLATACGDATDGDHTVRIYTSVTQDTVDTVVGAFQTANPDATVEVFRAPTGELAARIAAEQREGGLQADVLWLTDPLSIYQYAADGVLRIWTPINLDAVPAKYRTETFFGTRLLNIVIVAGSESGRLPSDWGDLATLEGVVAVPDPAFAGSAFGALAFFALDEAYGLSFYQDLRDNGVVQVQSPGDVVTGVAEGVYGAGMTLDRSATAAVEDGSPIEMVWPASGAIAIYSPIAVVDATRSDFAESFADFVIGHEAQQLIAGTGWQPIRTDVEWTTGGHAIPVDWDEAFLRQDTLLDEYRAIFGG